MIQRQKININLKIMYLLAVKQEEHQLSFEHVSKI